MAFTLLQVANTLKSINSTGALSDALSLPSGVQLAVNRVPRFAKFKRYVVMVNTPTRPLSIGDDGVVRLLTPSAPASAIALTGTVAGSLTGTYLALQTYKYLDSLGNIIAESDYGPDMSAGVAVSAKKLTATYQISPDDVDATQLYRTATLGSTYFSWAKVDDNVSTSYTADTADAALGLIEAGELGAPPDLTLIAEFAGRLWGVDRDNVDDLRYTQAGQMYAWAALNTLPIPHVGSDAAGITALIPRRNALGVGRRDLLLQVTGDQRSNFKPIVVNGGENVGVLSQESCDVWNDIAFFLWRDGVYKWDSSGVKSVSDGLVRSWFTSDLYFNRSMFWRAVGKIDPISLKYRLFLASLGSTNLDRWIEFDILTGAWFGPHKTDAFTPSSVVLVQGTDQQPYYMIGSREGFLSQDQEDRNDWSIAPIALSVETTSHEMKEPDSDKYFGELSVMAKQQASGTITVTPTVGELEGATAGTPMSYDMTSGGRQRLGRLGVGKSASLLFENDVIDEDVALFGYEINPVNIVGRR